MQSLLLLLLLKLLLLLQLPRALQVEAEELFQIPVRPLFSGHFGFGLVAVAVLALLDAGGHVCLFCFVLEVKFFKMDGGSAMPYDATLLTD